MYFIYLSSQKFHFNKSKHVLFGKHSEANGAPTLLLSLKLYWMHNSSVKFHIQKNEKYIMSPKYILGDILYFHCKNVVIH